MDLLKRYLRKVNKKSLLIPSFTNKIRKQKYCLTRNTKQFREIAFYSVKSNKKYRRGNPAYCSMQNKLNRIKYKAEWHEAQIRYRMLLEMYATCMVGLSSGLYCEYSVDNHHDIKIFITYSKATTFTGTDYIPSFPTRTCYFLFADTNRQNFIVLNNDRN